MHIHEIGRETRLRVGQPHPAQQAHCAFGQIVQDDVVDSGLQQLRHRHGAINEEGAAAADADCFHEVGPVRNYIGWWG